MNKVYTLFKFFSSFIIAKNLQEYPVIAAVPSFPGLRRFKDGRGFKQWTGDDSKALMKVYLPAIAGHVPDQMVRALSAFLDFCYLVRRSVINEDTLWAIKAALARFHVERTIFETSGVRENGFSLPRQHSLVHYPHLIQMFGAPNGLCSSITESKHIKAVKEPWQRSSQFEALGQMLLINQRLDKLAAAHVDFAARGMLNGPCAQLPNIVLEQLLQSAKAAPLPSKDEDGNSDDGASDDEEGAAEGNTIDAEVVLAKCYDIQSGSLSLLLRLVFRHFRNSSVASSTTK
ncbi:hypothetical protein PHLCEN_2v8110 [Hermanssonia centrifuga]|uniref:Uncharacterized protein n=1 Tax=Hermanssonia centrifuga TaxID=98765 RepID=A0A2R6NUK9_9APHY|nr:hypothetical protein PHLCEN_2v8110 [Hermanssonia centrifuga]